MTLNNKNKQSEKIVKYDGIKYKVVETIKPHYSDYIIGFGEAHGIKIIKIKTLDGKLHSPTPQIPAIKEYFVSRREKESLYNERYYKNNLIHRKNKPAYLEYDRQGEIRKEYYFVNGLLSRLDGPAVTIIDGNQTTLGYHFESLALTEELLMEIADWYKLHGFSCYDQLDKNTLIRRKLELGF